MNSFYPSSVAILSFSFTSLLYYIILQMLITDINFKTKLKTD